MFNQQDLDDRQFVLDLEGGSNKIQIWQHIKKVFRVEHRALPYPVNNIEDLEAFNELPLDQLSQRYTMKLNELNDEILINCEANGQINLCQYFPHIQRHLNRALSTDLEKDVQQLIQQKKNEKFYAELQQICLKLFWGPIYMILFYIAVIIVTNATGYQKDANCSSFESGQTISWTLTKCKCTACIVGYSLSENQNECLLTCPEGQTSTQLDIKQFKDGQMQAQNICISCHKTWDANCVDCDGKGCTKAKTGYFVDENGQVPPCHEAIGNCEECNQNGKSCTKCDDLTHPYTIRKDGLQVSVCITDCNYNSYYDTSTLKCEKCPSYSYQDPESIEQCMKPTCKGQREIHQLNNKTCGRCSEYMVANDDHTDCDLKKCREDLRIDQTASCLACEPYTIPSTDQLKCVIPRCASDEHVVENGCAKCGNKDEVQSLEDPKYCETKKCESPRQFLNGDGVCQNCDPYTRPTKDYRSCEQTTCDQYQVFTELATCSTCPYGKMPDPYNKKKCVPLECPGQNYKWDTKGIQCLECPDYHIRSHDNPQYCIPKKCEHRQKILKDGNCEPCEDYFSLDSGALNCYQKTCTYPYYAYTLDGECKEMKCGDYEGYKQDLNTKYVGSCVKCNTICLPKDKVNAISCEKIKNKPALCNYPEYAKRSWNCNWLGQGC